MGVLLNRWFGHAFVAEYPFEKPANKQDRNAADNCDSQRIISKNCPAQITTRSILPKLTQSALIVALMLE